MPPRVRPPAVAVLATVAVAGTAGVLHRTRDRRPKHGGPALVTATKNVDRWCETPVACAPGIYRRAASPSSPPVRHVRRGPENN